MKRRSRDEGSVRWLKDKQLWEGRYTYGYNENGSPKRKTIYGTENEKSIVLAKLREALVQLGKGQHVDPSDRTLITWCREWYENYKKPSLKTNTRSKYETSFVRLKRYDIADIPLKNLSHTSLQQCYNAMAESGNTETLNGLSEETIKATHALVNGALNKAEELNMIIKNPARHVVIPKNLDADADEEYHAKALSIEEKELFLQNLGQTTKHFMFAYFTLHTGLRPGEALALTINDVDLKTDKVKVTKTFLEKEHRVQNSTKTKSSRRTVDIPSELKKTIQEHIISLPHRKPTDPFFQTTTGNRPSQSYLRKRYKAVGEKIGTQWVNLHTMRHTYASDLFSKGIDIKIISAQLGHKDVTTTYDIYVHLIKTARSDAVQVLNEGILEKLPTKLRKKENNVISIT